MGDVRLFMILMAMANADIIKPLQRLVNPGWQYSEVLKQKRRVM